MDGVSDQSMTMIEAKNFRVEDDISTPPERHELLLRIVADIRLICDGKAIYEEESFPVVELAFFLERWLAEQQGTSFEFTSMEATEGPQIVFRFESNGYTVAAFDELNKCKQVVEVDTLKQAVNSFCQSVRSNSRNLIGFDAVEAVL